MNCKFVFISIFFSFYILPEMDQSKGATNLNGPILSVYIRLSPYRLRKPLQNLETATFQQKSISLLGLERKVSLETYFCWS